MRQGQIRKEQISFDNNVEVGSHTLEIRDREGGNYVVSGWTYLNIVKAEKPGDANGDGQVTVTDAVCIISYILGENPSPFSTSAADVNGDGSVTVTDAVQVIDLIQNP